LPEALTEVKAQPGSDIIVMGSGELVQSLMQHNLVDRYVLLIHPLVLGSGRKLFVDDGAMATLQLVDARKTTNGVVVTIYEPTRPQV
jgi:dihydrofolate reductase